MDGRLDLAVIESRWWNRSNNSVRGLFDVLAGIHKENPFGYHYEMFNTAQSLKEMIPRITRQRHIRHLYIGAHGDTQSLYGAAGRPENKISRAILKHILEDIPPRQLRGLFFGSCGFGYQTAELMEKTGLVWIAGYKEKVDWIHSSLMDIYFWHAYYYSKVNTAPRKSISIPMLTFLSMLYERVPYIFKELGLRVTFESDDGYQTFPDDYTDEIMGIREDAAGVIDSLRPGEWL